MRAALLMAGLLAGCSAAPVRAPAIAPPSGTTLAQVVVSAHLPAPLSVERLAVHFDDGTRQWTVHGRDLAHASGNVWRGTPQTTAASGTLHVRYVVTAPDATVVSEGSIDLPLRADWIHGVDIHAATEDPRRHCMGCQASVRFALAPQGRSPAADAVYVVWGGNSISNPVVY